MRKSLEAGAQPAFPPNVDVKRLACELPSHADVPLARFTIPDLRREVLARGVVAQISGVTLWRWLSADALQPWRHRSWIFPRDAQFAEKTGRVVDPYAKTWHGTALGPDEFVVSADEKPSLQVRQRKQGRAIATVNRALRALRGAINWGRFQDPPLLMNSPFHRFGVTIITKEETKRDRRIRPGEERGVARRGAGGELRGAQVGRRIDARSHHWGAGSLLPSRRDAADPEPTRTTSVTRAPAGS